ncbi:sialate O-acetylesterase [Marinilabilia rubra]|uniref:Sialate O-acetylesterase domain-containing protein n=1 Tax=Marinilabilia rubra TaxID=2162893 RepID=A0A2U2B8V9_9BACT|nr:sialate O-acetylesterase [Marinilabilia rubra]PWD99483.1 hypothetical protein DDZ16_10785 [Marinilabilia rubra]
MKNTIFLLLTGLMLISCGTPTEIKAETNKKKVFLFAGQSNMDGRGNGAELSKNDLERLALISDRILFYYNHQPVTPLQLTTPGKFVQKKFCLTKSFGPELFFGIELAEKYPDDEFIFIKRSVGGTSLYGCWNPDWSIEKASLVNEQDKAQLYSDFIEYTKSILETFTPNEYEIEGMLWVQGEADSNIKKGGEKPAETYGENLQNLVNAVRVDLKMPEMPFILFQVGSGKVVEGMKQVADNDDKVFMIPQSNDKESQNFYEQNPPPIFHYTTMSMKRIGIEFFKLYEKIPD